MNTHAHAHTHTHTHTRSEEHTSELQSHLNLVCRLLLEKNKETTQRCSMTVVVICCDAHRWRTRHAHIACDTPPVYIAHSAPSSDTLDFDFFLNVTAPPEIYTLPPTRRSPD